MKSQTVEDYINTREPLAQLRLRELRSILLLADSQASDAIKWGKPALVNDGILFVYAAFKQHISLHPTPSVISHLRHELSAYKVSENTVQFTLTETIPEHLVLTLARFRLYEKNTLGVGWK